MQTWPTGRGGAHPRAESKRFKCKKGCSRTGGGNPSRSRLMASGKGEFAVHCPLSRTVNFDKAANIEGGRPDGF